MKQGEINFLGNCSVCGSAYKEKDATVLEKKGEVLTFHVDCAECRSSVLLTVYSGANRGLVTTVGVPTDLAKTDLAKVKRSKRLTSDDVLELHTFLEKKDGNKDNKTAPAG